MYYPLPLSRNTEALGRKCCLHELSVVSWTQPGSPAGSMLSRKREDLEESKQRQWQIMI